MSASATLTDKVLNPDSLSDLVSSSLFLETIPQHRTSPVRHSTLSYDLIHRILSLVLDSFSTVHATPVSHLHRGNLQSHGFRTPTPPNSFRGLESNYAVLAKCSLVCHEFRIAAGSLLYREVVVSPKFNPMLNLREGLSVQASSNLISAMLPHNATYVMSFEISGYISPRPGPRNPLPTLIPLALKAFINLRRVVFTPATFHEQLFEEALPLLRTVPRLEGLIVNSSCFGGERPGIWGADEVVKVGIRETVNEVAAGRTESENDSEGSPVAVDVAKNAESVQKPVLKMIGLVSPGRAILERLPGWLERLKREGGAVAELYLKSNCGSVTPGVLRAILPHVKDCLTHLTLGLSYSLTDEDVFKFIGEMECLRGLKLRYYWQLKKPARQPALRNLHTFIVSHPELENRKDVIELCKWIRRAIKGSPALEILRLRSDEDNDNPDNHVGDGETEEQVYNLPSPAKFDPLIDHLASKHGDTLRVLDLGPGFLSVRAFKRLCEGCQALESLRARVGQGFFDIFTIDSQLEHLHSLDLRVIHIPKNYLQQKDKRSDWAREIFKYGPKSLHLVRFQGVQWQGRWYMDDTGKTKWEVEEVDRRVLKAPWRR